MCRDTNVLPSIFAFIILLRPTGSFATASCIRCGNQVKGDDIKDSIFKQEVAYCKVCKTPSPPPKPAKSKSKKRYSSSDEDESEEDNEDRLKGLMKPDIVFFGEKLPNAFDKSLKEDREQVDLLIVMGSSLKVAPVSDIMRKHPSFFGVWDHGLSFKTIRTIANIFDLVFFFQRSK